MKKTLKQLGHEITLAMEDTDLPQFSKAVKISHKGKPPYVEPALRKIVDGKCICIYCNSNAKW